MTGRRIAVFTSSRADLGPLGPVIQALDAEPRVQLIVIATGTHTARAFGGRLTDIAIGPDSVLDFIEAGIEGSDPAALAAAYGRIAIGVSNCLITHSPDFIVFLGDRWELLAAASAA